MLLSLFSSLFCQTPFAGLLLRQGDLRGVWTPFLEIGLLRPFSSFFCLFRPFRRVRGAPWEIQKSWDLLNPHLLNLNLWYSNKTTILGHTKTLRCCLGDQVSSSAGTERNCALPMTLPDPSPALAKKLCTRGCRNFIQHWGWGLEKGS